MRCSWYPSRMVRVVALCVLSGVLACGGDASKPAPEAEAKEAAPKADGGSQVEFPSLPTRGTVTLTGTGGAWKDTTFTGSPSQETFSKQAGTIYTQTTPKASGEKPLTYSFKRSLTSLGVGEHTVRDGFTVYGLDGGLESYTFSGDVKVHTIDAAAGVFAFTYVGVLALDGKDSAVQGGVNVQVPVSD